MLQGTAAVFTEIEIADGGQPAQLLPQPPLLSAGSSSRAGDAMAGAASGPSSSLHRALSASGGGGGFSRDLARSDSEALGAQVAPWRTPTTSPRASLTPQVRSADAPL